MRRRPPPLSEARRPVLRRSQPFLFTPLAVLACFAISGQAHAASPSSACTGRINVVVSVDFDETRYADAAGLRVRLTYPPTVVTLPGSKSTDQVNARVTNLTPLRADEHGEQALFGAADIDTNGDGKDDQVVIGIVTRSEPIRSGPLARIGFDCVTGVARPEEVAFRCTATASTRDGTSLDDVGCSVKIEERTDGGTNT